MKYHLILALIFLSKFSFGQENVINYFDSNYQFQLEKTIEEITKKSNIIGLGEATHGTKEFTIIRADIVKLLVTKHGLKNFILENGYMDCLKMNDYIHGKDLDSNIIFRNISWPWTTKEFLNLLHWMRDYNSQQNASEQITFYGADISNTPRIEFYKTQILLPETPPLFKDIWTIYFDTTKPQKEKLKLLNIKKKDLKNFNSKSDSLLFWNHFTSAYCWTLTGGKRSKYREENLAIMAEGIINSFVPQKNSSLKNSKFIIWAHNSHVSKKSTSRNSMGYFLNKSFGSNYTVIGFDFYQGKFRANNIDKPANTNRMEIFEVDSTSISSIKYIPKAKTEITFISLQNASDLFPKKFLIQNIGAAYSINLATKRKQFFTTKINRDKSFDYLIIIPKSSPSIYYRDK